MAAQRRFGGMAGAKPSGRNAIITHGSFLLEIDKITMTGAREQYFCVEFNTLARHGAKPNKRGDQPPEVGRICSYLVELPGRFPDSALADVKAISLMCPGADDHLWDDQKVDPYMERLISDEQIGKGTIVVCDAITKPQKGDPSKDYTYVNWHPFDPEYPPHWLEAEVEAGRFAAPAHSTL